MTEQDPTTFGEHENYDGLNTLMRRGANRRRAEHLLQYEDAPTCFEALNAQAWINEIRVESDGQLDVPQTAQKAGVQEIIYNPERVNGQPFYWPGMITGLDHEAGREPVVIYISNRYGLDHSRQTFGHELGHLFISVRHGLNQDYVDGDTSQNIETFCEYFGRQLTMPLEQVPDVSIASSRDVLRLTEQFGTTPQDAIFQLMQGSKLPRRLIIDASIGEVENPLYAHKVRRNMVCLDCENGTSHATTDTTTGTPIYDFTDQDWANHLVSGPCQPRSYLNSLDYHAALNKQYGQWSDQDEKLLLAEKQARKY